MRQVNKNICQSSTALGIWSMPRIQAELGRNAEMRWCSRGLSALGCWAGGPTSGWRPRQANGEKHGDQGTATLGKSMHPPSAGVRAVLWPGRTKVGYEPRAWNTSHKQGAVNATPYEDKIMPILHLRRSTETASTGGHSARPAILGIHPVWWRWHGNMKLV